MISWSYALRELGRRRGRSLLSLLSVTIAVAAIVAVTSATATTRRAYQQVFQALAGRADLEVVARGGGRFEQGVADAIRSLSGVRTIVPLFHRATIIYAGENKAKALAVGIVRDEPESLFGFEVTQGTFPAAAGEIALETHLAAGLGIQLGDDVRLLTSRGVRPYRISGIVALENAVRLRQGGMLLAAINPLQQAFRSVGEVDGLNIFLTESRRAAEVQSEVSAALPPELSVRVPSSRTGLAQETMLLTEVSLNMASALSFTTAVFIALGVFLMNVGERRQQLSIMRALGATRRQIIVLVCREALLTGIIGTLVGIPIGIYGGRFLTRSMAALLNASLPETPELYWGLVAGGLVGPAICLLAAWYPAYMASRVSPLEGMRPVVTVRPERGHRATTVVGLAGLVVAAVVEIGLARGELPIWCTIFDLILSLVSLVLLAPVALLPGVKLLVWPVRRWLTIEGEMSERLVLRHAGRSSLTIGVLFIAICAGVGTSNAVFSVTDDVRTWYERTVPGDFLIRAMMPDMTGQDAVTLSDSIDDEIVALDDVEKAEALRLLRIEAAGQDAMMIAREFRLYDHLPLDLIGGESRAIRDCVLAGEVVVGSVLAERTGVHAGDVLRVTFGTENHAFRVAGVATEYTFGGSVVYADRSVAQRLFHIEGADSFLIKSKPGKAAQLAPELARLARQNGLLLQSFAEVLQLIDSMVAGVTGGLWVLLTLGLLVGALGVVNTLTMNVLEQTRELGMLRAIGMRRGQIIKAVLGQAALIGLLGVLAGGIAGTSLARMINVSLGSMFGHYIAFALRPQFIALLLVVALAVVLLSALVPARRAARLNPIEAMRQE
ncbi:MAG: ABC transporter permease [Planctomycetia bacterium]|nr:ABC transporter permease [Planctomycetia bacterium]